MEAHIESFAIEHADDLRRATYEAKKILADSYLDVLISLKEKWVRKKVTADCEARLREVMVNIDLLKEILNHNLLASDELSRLQAKEAELGDELDVALVSNFLVGKLDLSQVPVDLPEEFFCEDPL